MYIYMYNYERRGKRKNMFIWGIILGFLGHGSKGARSVGAWGMGHGTGTFFLSLLLRDLR
jgi:hypothetical protein